MRPLRDNLGLLCGAAMALAVHWAVAATYVAVSGGPRLQLLAFENLQPEYGSNQTLEPTLVAANHGAAPTPPATISWFLGTDAEPRRFDLDTVSQTSIEPGHRTKVLMTPKKIDESIDPGLYRLTAVWREPGGRVSERRSEPFRLRAERPELEPLADLVAQRLVRPAKLPIDQKLPFKAVVTNRGAEAQDVVVRVRAGRGVLFEKNIGTLSPGEVRLLPFEYKADRGGLRRFELEVDPDGSVPDLSRPNNRLVRNWLFEDPNRPQVGQAEPKEFAINFISYEDFQKLQSTHRHRYDQATVQKTDPTVSTRRPRPEAAPPAGSTAPADDRKAKPQPLPNEKPQTAEAFPKADDA
ncbi:MAG: CARDB domain-containing protein, partial [Phycisphaeraceae bacterium]|nr:CARDB domain-containing protein [Phycisphaeraceae bacterium]